MAQSTRMAFFCKDNKLFFKYYTFEFFGGFAISQKRKTISSFHNSIKKDGIYDILEVSRRNEDELGLKLSAFNLKITINYESYPVECIYQSSKVFGDLQFKECLLMAPGDAKRYIKNKVIDNSLNLTEFKFKDVKFPLNPKSFYYDYLYILALFQNVEIAKKIINYDCFTDIEFNHKKQYASQARACAIYKYLYMNDKLQEFISNPFEFYYLYDNLQENLLI